MDEKNTIIDFNKKAKELKNTKKDFESKDISKKNKLIAFPESKVISIKKALQADENFKSILGGRVISTILGLFILTVGVQSLWLSTKDKNNSRGLASSISRSLAVVETYLSTTKRSVASIAIKPKPIEHFNFAVLHGYYQLKTEGNWISSLSSNGKFISIGSSSRFLKKHKHLWKIKFSSLQLSHSDSTKKIYKLFNQQKKMLGKAIFQLNGQGQLQSLSFSKKQL